MPTAALLPSFPALVKIVLHGTFPRPGAFRPGEVQTGTCSSRAVSCDPISLHERERAGLARQRVTHS